MTKAWRLHGPGGPFRFEDVPAFDPPAGAVAVRVGAAMVLGYMGQVLDGSLGYAVPGEPFVPGTNAIGTVEAVGPGVYHLAPGQRVFLSPHLVANERVADPAQILIGLTAMGAAAATVALQSDWRDGVFAERTTWPAACATPLDGLDHVEDDRLAALAKLVVPFGGLLRGRLAPGETVLVNGASGFYGSAAVMLALGMGAGRIVAVGRDRAALDEVVALAPERVRAAALTGEVQADVGLIRDAAGGGADLALDIVGRAASTDGTLACLRALRRGGRLVLMGSASVPLPITFAEMLANNWEILGQFMYPPDAPARLAGLVRAGLVDLAPVRVNAFPLQRLPDAIEAAAKMRTLDLTVVVPERDGR